MIHKYSIKMSLDYMDDKNNIVSTGELIVGKAHTLEEASEMLEDTKHSFVDLSYGISNNENVNYKRRKVHTNNFLAMTSNGSVREAIKTIEIIEN